MVTFSPGIRNFVSQSKGTASAIGGALRTTGQKFFGFTQQTGGVAGSAVGGATRLGTSLLDKTFNAFGNALRPLKWTANKFPVMTTGAVVLGGAAVMKGHYDRKRDNAMAQMQAREQASYMATTNPEEYALMQERMRGSMPGQQGGHANKVLADREAASQQIQ